MSSQITSDPIGAPAVHDPVELMRDFETYRPSVDELWQQFKNNFSPQHAPKSQPARELNLSLIVSPDEAIAGGHFSIDVPVANVCDRCAGTGSTGFFECDLCDGHGMSWNTARVIVSVPAGVRDENVIPISLTNLGVKNLFLNVHVRVTA